MGFKRSNVRSVTSRFTASTVLCKAHEGVEAVRQPQRESSCRIQLPGAKPEASAARRQQLKSGWFPIRPNRRAELLKF